MDVKMSKFVKKTSAFVLAVATAATMAMSVSADSFNNISTDYGTMSGTNYVTSYTTYRTCSVRTMCTGAAPTIRTTVSVADYGSGSSFTPASGVNTQTNATSATVTGTIYTPTNSKVTVFGAHEVVGRYDSWGEYTTTAGV